MAVISSPCLSPATLHPFTCWRGFMLMRENGGDGNGVARCDSNPCRETVAYMPCASGCACAESVWCRETPAPCPGGACLPPAGPIPRNFLLRRMSPGTASSRWRSSRCVSSATVPTWARTSNWSAVRRAGRSGYTTPHNCPALLC